MATERRARRVRAAVAPGGGELGPGIGIAELPEPVPVQLEGSDALLGPNDDEAVEAVLALFAASGVDLTGIDVFVFPIADAGESLLVLDADMDTLTTLSESTIGSDDVSNDDLLVRMSELPEIVAANVTKVAMNLRSNDEQGPFVMTISLPLAALDSTLR